MSILIVWGTLAQVVIPTWLTNAVQYIMQTVRTDDGTDSGLVNVNIDDTNIYIRTWFLANGTWWNNKALGVDTSGNVVYVDANNISNPFNFPSANYIPKINSTQDWLDTSRLYEISWLMGINTITPAKSLDIFGDFQVTTPWNSVVINYQFYAPSITSSTLLSIQTIQCSCDTTNAADCTAPFSGSPSDPLLCADITSVDPNDSNKYFYDLYERIDTGIPEAVLVTSWANVWVRTTNPLAALDVSGDVMTSSSIISRIWGNLQQAYDVSVWWEWTRFMWLPNITEQNSTNTWWILRIGDLSSNYSNRWDPWDVWTRSVAIWQNVRAKWSYSVAFGATNNVNTAYSNILWGWFNSITWGVYSTIAWGASNIVDGEQSIIAGWWANQIQWDNSVIWWGKFNESTWLWNKIWWWRDNLIGNISAVSYATIWWWNTNIINSANSTIGWGYWNNIQQNWWKDTIWWWFNNNISNPGNFDSSITIAWWRENTASQSYATIAGWRDNLASGISSFIWWWYQNIAGWQNSAVLWGESNTANGSFSTVAGGLNNQALWAYSFAAGQNATAANNNSFIRSDGTAATTTNNQSFVIQANGWTWINSSPVWLWLTPSLGVWENGIKFDKIIVQNSWCNPIIPTRQCTADNEWVVQYHKNECTDTGRLVVCAEQWTNNFTRVDLTQ